MLLASLSSTSINRILSRALIRLTPDDLEFREIRIDNLPLYSPDYDSDYPPEALAPRGGDPPPTRCSSSARSATGPSPKR